jgi:hypothetical protein
MEMEIKPPKKPKKQPRKEYITDLSPFKKQEENNPVIPSDAYNDLTTPDEMFQNSASGGTDQNPAKSLFDPKNPKIKSEFTNREIKIISRLYILGKEVYEPLDITMLKEVLDEFVLLRISMDRKSRLEFVETHRETRKDQVNNLMQKMLGGNGGL